MKKLTNPVFIVISGVIIAIGRCLLEKITDNDSKDFAVLLIMAIVNCLALGFVILFLSFDISQFCKNKIESSGIDTQQKKMRKKTLSTSSNILSIILLLLYFIFAARYIALFRSNSFNDAISVVALAISITAKDLAAGLGGVYYDCIFKYHQKKQEKLRK